MFDISIVIPVYNTGVYLPRCLNSIFSQSFTGSYEVIVLDACSTDNSVEVLEDYEISYKNFKLIRHTKREALSTSRATGMNLARGNYIMHVDSDDWLLSGSLQIIYDELMKYPDIQVHVYNYVSTDSNGNIKFNPRVIQEFMTIDKNLVRTYFLSTVWNKIIRRDLAFDLIYSNYPVTVEEDLIYSAEILLKAETFRLSKSYIYSYFDNSSSLTKTIKPTIYLGKRAQQLEILKEIFDKYDSDNDNKEFLLKYFERGIFIELTRLHLFGGHVGNDINEQFSELINIGLLCENSLKRIKLSINSQWISYYYFVKIVSWRHFFGLIKIKYLKYYV
jgi:glycosyltransferase involved in cell wall biosynthesis